MALIGASAITGCVRHSSEAMPSGASMPSSGGDPDAIDMAREAFKPAESVLVNSPCMAPCGLVGGAPYGDKALLDADLRWGKRRLEVKFFGGSPYLRGRVIAMAGTWSKYCGITFMETSNKGDIRISFDPKGGHWSHIGTYAQRINRRKATMNLQVSDSTSDMELRTVVLHEFGHALGFLHEHRRGDSGLVWNEEEVYRYYMGYPNFWKAPQVKEQVLDRIYVRNPIETPYDRKSIMHYPMPQKFLKRGRATGWNRELSANDQAAVRRAYPKL